MDGTYPVTGSTDANMVLATLQNMKAEEPEIYVAELGRKLPLKHENGKLSWLIPRRNRK